MLPEEEELARLEAEQTVLEDEVTSAELALETTKTEIAQFQHRYYRTVGRLFAQLDELDAKLAHKEAERAPDSSPAQAKAAAAQKQSEKSAEEAGLVEALPTPPPEITPELKHAYRQAAKLIHPDRATTESERLRRTTLMAQVNRAYEIGDQTAIEKLISEFGQDPEAIAGADVASRIVKSIRRIAQFRRRLGEVQKQMDAMQQTEIFSLKKTIEETEALGGTPLEDLAKKLMQQLSERMIELEIGNA